MRSTIRIPAGEDKEFASVVAELYARGVTFTAEMECGDWVITLR
jgi:hypothetical protein